MNQDQIKAFLKKVRSPAKDFTVILTGKASRKVNGLYKPDTAEILLHNKNFKDDADMLRTALHEYAHHLHSISATPPAPGRPHTPVFWALFHDLLGEAEKKGLYTDVFRSDPEFCNLTKAIKEKFVGPYGSLLTAFGEKLLEAESLCRRRSLNFRDYVERELGMKIPTARLGMDTVRRGLDPELGPDKLKTLSRLPAEAAAAAGKLFSEGATEAQVLTRLATSQPAAQNSEPAKQAAEELKRKKERLQALIEKYRKELEEVEAKMKSLGKKESV